MTKREKQALKRLAAKPCAGERARCTIALDPRVSEAAAKLLEKSAWNKVADVEPPSDRAVFTWHETCGLFYYSYWNSETKSFDLAWKPTYWMERPTNPVSPDSPHV